MFQDLAEYQIHILGTPRGFWNYMDEGYVGQIASMAMSRGGPLRATTIARKVMDRSRALMGRD